VAKFRPKKPLSPFRHFYSSPEAITIDGLRSHKAAMSELGCEGEQEIGRWANNRVENSHLSFRQRERAMLQKS
jgi:putative transposase